jgi:hypothetical protein
VCHSGNLKLGAPRPDDCREAGFVTKSASLGLPLILNVELPAVPHGAGDASPRLVKTVFTPALVVAVDHGPADGNRMVKLPSFVGTDSTQTVVVPSTLLCPESTGGLMAALPAAVLKMVLPLSVGGVNPASRLPAIT